MKESIIQFEDAQSDLDMSQPEHWSSVTFAEMRNHLISVIEQIEKYKPRSHRKLIRKGSFLIKKSTTLDSIKQLGRDIEKKYGIHSFQAVINRSTNTAEMLFSWVNEETAEMYVLNHADLKKLSVLILRHLNLPRPAAASMWVRYFLTEAYEEDPEIFQRQIGELVHWGLDKESYEILHDSLSYADMVCRGLLK